MTREVATVLGVREESARPLEATLLQHLSIRRTLLLLDSCEHVVEMAAKLVTSLLHACPILTVLATSREALRINGEATWQVKGPNGFVQRKGLVGRGASGKLVKAIGPNHTLRAIRAC